MATPYDIILEIERIRAERDKLIAELDAHEAEVDIQIDALNKRLKHLASEERLVKAERALDAIWDCLQPDTAAKWETPEQVVQQVWKALTDIQAKK